MRYKGGNQVPPNKVRQINEEKKATQNIGNELLASVGEVQEAVGKLADCIREAGKAYHGEEIEMKISELRRRTANITVSLGQMKILSGSIATSGKANLWGNHQEKKENAESACGLLSVATMDS